MITQHHEYRRFFEYKDSQGNRVGGASSGLNLSIRQKGGAVVPAQKPITEPFPADAPGVYQLCLTSEETAEQWVQWVVTDTAGVLVDYGVETTHPLPESVFGDIEDDSNREAFLNRVADHVLRRSVAQAEISANGDSVSGLSMLGLALMLLNGQQVWGKDINGNYFIPINSSKPGHNPIAQIPVTVSGGRVTGTLPFGVTVSASAACDPC